MTEMKTIPLALKLCHISSGKRDRRLVVSTRKGNGTKMQPRTAKRRSDGPKEIVLLKFSLVFE